MRRLKLAIAPSVTSCSHHSRRLRDCHHCRRQRLKPHLRTSTARANCHSSDSGHQPHTAAIIAAMLVGSAPAPHTSRARLQQHIMPHVRTAMSSNLPCGLCPDTPTARLHIYNGWCDRRSHCRRQH